MVNSCHDRFVVRVGSDRFSGSLFLAHVGSAVALGTADCDTHPTPNDDKQGNMNAGRVLTATADGGGDPKLNRVLRVHYEMLHIPCNILRSMLPFDGQSKP